MEIDNFLPGSAALIDLVDKRLLVSLRDGNHYYGILISYDQFANLVLDDCYLLLSNTLADEQTTSNTLERHEQTASNRLADEQARVNTKQQSVKMSTTSNDNEYTYCGIMLIRGENVVLMGEIDNDWKTPPKTTIKSQAKRIINNQRKKDILYQLGFCVETIEGDHY